MAATWVDFKQIKASVAIEQVLKRYGARVRRIGGELRGPCPLPTHTSRRSRDSFSVSPSRNVWSCRSQSCMQARGGRAGGNILDLVALMDGCSVREAALRVQDWSDTFPPRDPVLADEVRPAANVPLRFMLHHIDWQHPYLAARGLTAETIRAFGVGIYRGKGFLRGRIVIPIHNEHGELVAYVGRGLGDAVPKYRFPAGFKKSQVLFNLHRACATGARTVFVVEGFFDTFAVHQAGYPAVVALMGSTLSAHQAELVSHAFDRVLLMLDGDEAGRQGTAMITRALATRTPVNVITLGEGAQPDQLAPEQVHRLIDSHADDACHRTGVAAVIGSRTPAAPATSSSNGGHGH